MLPKIRLLSEKRIIGISMEMSLKEDKTGLLWRNFMSKRSKIQNTTRTELYSIQQYDPDYFDDFNPEHLFEKWAAIGVSNFDTVPDTMKTLLIPKGLYAVFIYKGDPRKGAEVFEYIFRTWLPNSEYAVDNRPHFEVLGEKYKNNAPDSEEEIWIPVQLK